MPKRNLDTSTRGVKDAACDASPSEPAKKESIAKELRKHGINELPSFEMRCVKKTNRQDWYFVFNRTPYRSVKRLVVAIVAAVKATPPVADSDEERVPVDDDEEENEKEAPVQGDSDEHWDLNESDSEDDFVYELAAH